MRKLLVAFLGSALILGIGIHPQPSVGAVKEEHCTARLEAGSGRIMEYRCFATFSEAIAHATGGQVTLAESSPASRLAPETFAALQSQTVIGIDYDNAGYSGASLTWYVQNSFGCLGGWSYFVDFMPSGWNDRVSSAAAYGGCNSWRHYEHTGRTGMVIVCSCGSMGSMDNKTSSEFWSQ